MTGWSEKWASLDGWLTEVGTKNGEVQTYVAEGQHQIVTSGTSRNLRITASRQLDNTWRSALLRAKPERYIDMTVPGTLSVRVKAPYLPGIWPAVWLIGERSWMTGADRVGWPECGEVDILEIPGVKREGRQPLLHGNMHGLRDTGKRWDVATPVGYRGLPGWLTVGLEIAPGALTWTIDGIPRALWREEPGRLWPFGTGPRQSQRAGLILNVAVGGWANDLTDGTPDASMEIGEVRYTAA